MRKVKRGQTYVPVSSLDHVERLGLAFCRLNNWEWDPMLGPKPEGFDDLPHFDPRGSLMRKIIPRRTKEDYITPVMHRITEIIGKANTSRCWWLFSLGRTEREWLRWYLLQDSTLPELLS